MKAIYIQPATDVVAVETYLMQLTVSPAGGNGPGGSSGNDAPARRGIPTD